MIACVDAHYWNDVGAAACVVFPDWGEGASASEHVQLVDPVEPYTSGQLYKRELPCLLAVLHHVDVPLEAILVDSYVWLDDHQTPGLGAHLYAALGGKVPVVGIAKTRFFTATQAATVLRGQSTKPLFVSSAGMELSRAVACVQALHGAHRLPTVVQRADHLAREAVAAHAAGRPV